MLRSPTESSFSTWKHQTPEFWVRLTSNAGLLLKLA